MQFFCYSSIYGFELFNTAEAARGCAGGLIEYFNSQSDEEWDEEEIESICWGAVIQEVVGDRSGGQLISFDLKDV